MAVELKNVEEKDYEGCYGEISGHYDVRDYLFDFINNNIELRKRNKDKFSACIWGHAGLGKTSLVKQLENFPISYKGVDYKGFKVVDVPLAQFEEMGDLHGMPSEAHLMHKENHADKWVPIDVIEKYSENGWELDTETLPQTISIPPYWVPQEDIPTILLIDDWNRAAGRIIKGIMQLLQNYRMTSWSLPDGCHIILTGNPANAEYGVTTVDDAILTRINHITLKTDPKAWVEWATCEELDPRGINWVLAYPEMMVGNRTNPRTLEQLFRFSKSCESMTDSKTQKRFSRFAHGLLDDDTVSNITVFFTRNIGEIPEPSEIIFNDSAKSAQIVEDLRKMFENKGGTVTTDNNGKKSTEKRVDIINIVCERLIAFIKYKENEIGNDKNAIENLKCFLEKGIGTVIKDDKLQDNFIPSDMLNSMLNILVRQAKKVGFKLVTSKILQKFIQKNLQQTTQGISQDLLV